MNVLFLLIVGFILPIPRTEISVPLMEINDDRIMSFVESFIDENHVFFIHIDHNNACPHIEYRLSAYDVTEEEAIGSWSGSTDLGMIRIKGLSLFVTGEDPCGLIRSTGEKKTFFIRSELCCESIIDDCIPPKILLFDSAGFKLLNYTPPPSLSKYMDDRFIGERTTVTMLNKNGNVILRSAFELNDGGLTRYYLFKEKYKALLVRGANFYVREQKRPSRSESGALIILVDKNKKIIDHDFAPSYFAPSKPKNIKFVVPKIGDDELSAIVKGVDIDGRNDYYAIYVHVRPKS